jgi:hypothetical protein
MGVLKQEFGFSRLLLQHFGSLHCHSRPTRSSVKMGVDRAVSPHSMYECEDSGCLAFMGFCPMIGPRFRTMHHRKTVPRADATQIAFSEQRWRNGALAIADRFKPASDAPLEGSQKSWKEYVPIASTDDGMAIADND